jgi:hypothetical protein
MHSEEKNYILQDTAGPPTNQQQDNEEIEQGQHEQEGR